VRRGLIIVTGDRRLGCGSIGQAGALQSLVEAFALGQELRVIAVLLGAELCPVRHAGRRDPGPPCHQGSPYKQYLEIGDGTHAVLLERNRMQLFPAVQRFLDEPVP
jgi:hypothetical protein